MSAVVVDLVEVDIISTVVNISVALGLGLHGPASVSATKSAAIKAEMIVLAVILDSNHGTQKHHLPRNLPGGIQLPILSLITILFISTEETILAYLRKAPKT